MRNFLLCSLLVAMLALVTACGQNNQVAGDWKYQGLIGSDIYEVGLDLEENGTFDLNIENESNDALGDSELKGTYTSTADTITLSVEVVDDTNSYYKGSSVNNEQFTIDYSIDNNAMTIKNASQIIGFFPSELVLRRD